MSRIAISNLAWPETMDEQVFELMGALGITSLELSPFRDCADIAEVGRYFSTRMSKSLSRNGISVVALQALMFRQPTWSIFGSNLDRSNIFKHLVHVLDFSKKVGAGIVVFGSPKNRIRGEMSPGLAFDVAVEFFKKIAAAAQDRGVVFCLEPTPAVYGTDFVINTSEAVHLVNAVGNGSFKLNFDIGAALLNNEMILENIENNFEKIAHFHISEPYLKTIDINGVDHIAVARKLEIMRYTGIVSIEMKADPSLDLKGISDILSHMQRVYDNGKPASESEVF